MTLRTLTLHMLEFVAPRLFASRRLGVELERSLAACHNVTCGFDQPIDGDRLQAGVDAWFCRTVRHLPHPPPPRGDLETAIAWLTEENLIYAWLIAAISTRCGLEVRVPLASERPFLHSSKVLDAYFLTHLVMLDTDYFARPLSAPRAAEWADALSRLVPWLVRKPNLDLIGEVVLCLRVMKVDCSPLMPLLRAAPVSDDAHAQATILLGLSVE